MTVVYSLLERSFSLFCRPMCFISSIPAGKPFTMSRSASVCFGKWPLQWHIPVFVEWHFDFAAQRRSVCSFFIKGRLVDGLTGRMRSVRWGANYVLEEPLCVIWFEAGIVGEEDMSVGLIHFRALWVFTHRGPMITFGHICNPFGITLIHLLLSEHMSHMCSRQ